MGVHLVKASLNVDLLASCIIKVLVRKLKLSINDCMSTMCDRELMSMALR